MDVLGQVVVRRPESALAPLISAIGYYRARLPHARERALPTGHSQLLVNSERDWARAPVGR
ncbi:MAG: hypothetical protein GEV12_01580 [Micromonosporaceae bacterium]|nr:hypothetical protein [Micromonosporaceae bacterium]